MPIFKLIVSTPGRAKKLEAAPVGQLYINFIIIYNNDLIIGDDFFSNFGV